MKIKLAAKSWCINYTLLWFIKQLYSPTRWQKLVKVNKCVSKTHIRQTRGGDAVKLCATPSPPFSGTTFPSLIACLCLAYCRLLKLTTASNADARFTKYRSITADRGVDPHVWETKPELQASTRRWRTHDQSCRSVATMIYTTKRIQYLHTCVAFVEIVV